jgi:glc operon protein GlcG
MKSRRYLTAVDCTKVGAAAEEFARSKGWNVTVAIVDDGGHLLHFVRMDGTTPANAEIAIQKARTSALTRHPSRIWEERIAAGRLSMLGMPVLPVQGGLPIFVEGHCLGAVGVSGVQSHEDEEVAQAGIAFLLELSAGTLGVSKSGEIV